MSITEIAAILGGLGTVLGGGGWIRYFSERKKNDAEAERTEIDASVIINQQWQALFDKYKMETEYQISQLRDRIETLERELEKEKARVKELEKNGHTH